jgi:Ras-related protein Rab-7A
VNTKASFEHLQKWKDEFIVHAVPSNSDSFPFVVLGKRLSLSAELTDIRK